MRMRSRGFNIVEIMVIIAMVGLVIAVAVPAFMRNRAINGARVCQENLGRIDGALDAYRLEMGVTEAPLARVEDLVARSTGTVGLLAEVPRCPAGGRYGVEGGEATCSVGENVGARYAPHVHTTELPFVK